MPEVLLKLVVDPVTGERSVVIDYKSDADALPMEHEEEHRALVDKVMSGGRQVDVERVDEGGVAEAPPVAEQEVEGRKQGA